MDVTTLILGAGAAGLYAAAAAGPGTLVVDHAARPAEKVRISGGGRCNFTNTRTTAAQFLSANPHFAKSALARHGPQDFVALVRAARIAFHEKTLGQLFCDGSSRQIVDLLVARAEAAGAELWLSTAVGEIGHDGTRFVVALDRDGRAVTVRARHLVVATGGKSIPKMGATGLAYRIAAQFGLAVTDTRPGLVPFTFGEGLFAGLAGLSLPVRARAGRASFDEALLFTHRGLSGPAMLQISSFWHEGEAIAVDLTPGTDLAAHLRAAKATTGRRALRTALAEVMPARLADHLMAGVPRPDRPLAEWPDAGLSALAAGWQDWRLRPTGTEGWRTAEVTLGGVATAGLSSATMEAKAVPGLFFIGECVDVTGWLGGYNFQWAWSSAQACGTAIAARGGV